MKKNYVLFIVLFLLIIFNKAEAQTLTFTSDAGTLWNDGIATDGEGGSTDILGLAIEIYNVNDALNNIAEIEWKSAGELSGTDNFTGLTTFAVPYGSTTGWKGHIIKEASGLEFQINGFDWFDWGNYNNQPMTVTGFKNGSQVAITTFVGNNNGNRVSVNLNSSFDNVDEVRILTTSGTTYPTINNVQIANAVLSNASNTVIGSKIVVQNNKFISNTKDVKIEVYSVLGQKLENQNLASGVYILRVTLNDGKMVALKRYI
ncbi:T9SS type A sorting domain-containing protein [Mariniflexile jejuense]|uniref:T9SS type A sorting domain-containing protein n=1 Tax=Mariniflexile jejuense TaxID=1173582 RepID=A0ABW3JJD7_9FLAO